MRIQTMRTIKSQIPSPAPIIRHFDRLLQKMIERMELAVKEWPNSQYTEKGLEDLPKGDLYGFIVKDIKNEMERSNILGKQYSFVIGTRTFTIFAVYPFQSPSVNIYPYMDASVKKMFVWLFVASAFFQSNCSQHTNIYWYISDQKKELPSENIVLNKEHVNTAFTYPCPHYTNSIYLFRREEWFKVFVHETFHSYGLDFSDTENNADERLRQTFKITVDIRFSEAYTEVWAEIICMMFSAVREYSTTEPFIRISRLKRNIEGKLHGEIAFSVFQMCKILRHNKMEYEDFFVSNAYREKTNVFSYFFLKTILLYFYNDFLEWSITHNGYTLRINKNAENIESLVEFIEKRCKNPGFLHSIQNMKRVFSPSILSHDEMKTLRMTTIFDSAK